ncbi:MAG: helix-turn-helix domain-containing protein [Coriobacteriales bacterium]|jgi:transcriptional regulator with XRE-family HTH domain|nr:helix-turn-helix domain-containing protein [Coriobacteriales bacterium]
MAETFGAILAEARTHRGLSLEQVSNVLRIRPAILASLEREDYFAMPLKGHSRNMVSAYSRYLGLDSAAVTELFLKNYRDFENAEAARRGVRQKIPIEQRSVPNTVATPTPPANSKRTREQPIDQGQGQGVRSIWDKPTPHTELRGGIDPRGGYELHGGYDSRSPKTQRSAKNAARRRPFQGSRNNTASDTATAIRQNQPQKADIGQTVQRLMASTPLPLVLLVVILVGLLVIWAVVANACGRDNQAIIPIQSGGQSVFSDADNLIDSLLTNPGGIDNTPIGPDYGPFELVVEPAPGEAPWVSITVDGSTVFADVLTETKYYSVNINCRVETGQPSNTTVKRNSVIQELDITDQGIGSVEMEVIQKPINDKTTNPPVDDQQGNPENPDNQGGPVGQAGPVKPVGQGGPVIE